MQCISHVQESEVLAKAYKEHERRKGEKEGFAYTPADALAFKYYRDVSKPELWSNYHVMPHCCAGFSTLHISASTA